MNDKKGKQMSETFCLGALLAVIGGFLDAYTYLTRGRVFANAQTGNLVLLAMNLAGGQFQKAQYYLIPILAFIAGVLIAEVTCRCFQKGRRLHWRQIIILLEIITLASVAFLPAGNWDMAANVLVSLVCSIQVQGFRKINGNHLATTMCTGNLRSGTELLIHFLHTRDLFLLRQSLSCYGIILFFLVGAAAGAWFCSFWGIRSILLCCFLLCIVFFMMFFEPHSPGKKHALP